MKAANVDLARGQCLVCERNLLDDRRCQVFRRSRKHKDTCRCGHLASEHELVAEARAGEGAAKVPPALLRVARAFDETRDAVLAALSGHQVSGGVMKLGRGLPDILRASERASPPASASAHALAPAPAPQRQRAPTPPLAPVDGLARGPQAILTVIAQTRDRGATRQQIAVLTGYKTRSITTYVSELRQRGYVEHARLVATAEGVAALGPDYEPLPTGDKLREHWIANLPQGELRLFEVVLACYPGGADRAKLREMTGYAERSVTTHVSALVSRRIVVKVGREWRASDELYTRRGAA